MMRHVFFSCVAMVLAMFSACATSTNRPSYVTEQPTRTPLSQRKITANVFTNAPTATPPSDTIPVKDPARPQAQTQPPPRARVVPLSARIASVNEQLRFVVIDFSNSRRPGLDERLNVYRAGEKVAELKVSGPYRNATVAADIVAGEVMYGDEVKTH